MDDHLPYRQTLINDEFWKKYWGLLDSRSDGDFENPEEILKSIRSIGALHLLRESSHETFSLFSITWTAYTLAMSSVETASFLSGLSPVFRWSHGLACLVVLELACSCENGCNPDSNSDVNAMNEIVVGKSTSPFFPMLVQSALAMLHRTTEHGDDEGPDDMQLAHATILDFIERAVLPEMLGKEVYAQVEHGVSTGFISDEVRCKVDEAVHRWTSVYENDRHKLSPLLTLASAVKDEAEQQDIRKLMITSPFLSVERIPSSNVLSVDTAFDKVAIPFARPLPPPSFPLVGYEEDDFEATTSAEQAELLDYLHAELIWCTPICNRLMLLPDDEDEDKEANELNRQVLDLLQHKAFVKPLALNERRQVIELLSTSDQAERLMQEAGLSPKNLPLLVEYNPLVAHECLLKVLQSGAEEEKNEYLSSLVGMDMSLHSMEVVNRLATHYVVSEPHEYPEVGNTANKQYPIRNEPTGSPKPKPILHPEYIHLFIGSCIASCENIQDRHAQNRLVRLVCVFIQSLLRNKIVETEDIYFEVQSFCVEFSRIREASALFKSLKQQSTG